MGKFGAVTIVVGLLLGTLLFASVPARANPSIVSVDLYGSELAGWGLSSSSESNPGPQITVHQGDTVTITLHSTDGHPHKFFVDYNNDHALGAGEPNSSSFSATTTINFAANQVGTFTYYCQFHPTSMKGDFVVLAAESSGNPTPSGTDNTFLIVGVVVIVVAAAGVGGLLLMRRKGQA
jgi:FtsP/CotA-like multicopper oxidase with cupredoxin domain